MKRLFIGIAIGVLLAAGASHAQMGMIGYMQGSSAMAKARNLEYAIDAIESRLVIVERKTQYLP